MGKVLQFPKTTDPDDGNTALLPRRHYLAEAIADLVPFLDCSGPSTTRALCNYRAMSHTVDAVIEQYIELVRLHRRHPAQIRLILLEAKRDQLSCEEAPDRLVQLDRHFHDALVAFGNLIMSNTWAQELTLAAPYPSPPA